MKLLIPLILLVIVVVAEGQERVRLVDITALTFDRNRMTTGRRLPPVPQLRCVGGCGGYEPSVVQCYNRGHQGRRVQWECRARFPYGYRFGRIRVECEGYDSSDDEFVLAGSCGLEYTMERSQTDRGSSTNLKSSDIIIIVVVGIVVIGICLLCVHQTAFKGGTPGYVSPAPIHPPGFIAPTTYMGGPSPFYSPMGMSSGPGFWTGAATGGLVGYMLGSNYHDQPRGYCPPPAYTEFGGGGGGGFIEDTAFADTDMR